MPRVPPLPHQEATMGYRIAGIDVHKKVLMAVVLDVEAGQPEVGQRRRFGATTSELIRLRLWLGEKGGEETGREATAPYWRPGWGGIGPPPGLPFGHAYSHPPPRGRTTP